MRWGKDRYRPEVEMAVLTSENRPALPQKRFRLRDLPLILSTRGFDE
jgi:hypothetical protein